MNQRLLLGSTALVGAGVLFAGGANQAHAQASPIKVTLSGYTEIGIHSATRNSLNEPGEGNGTGDQGYTGFMDTELHIQAQGTTEGGTISGSYVALDVFQPEDVDSNSNVHTDEANLFFSGGFGRVELGRQDGAEDVMFVGAEDAQSGTGGVDGDNKNLVTVYHISFGDAAKATYFTPRIAGFQFGASLIPDNNDNGGLKGNGGFRNAATAGANWVGSFSGVDLTLAAVGGFADSNGSQSDPEHAGQTTSDNNTQASIGGLIGAGGLSFGVTAGRNFDFLESNWANVGLKYKFGAASASVGYAWFDPDSGKTQNFYVVSGDVGLMPGVTLKGDVSYNSNDPTAGSPSNLNLHDTSSTWSGTVSVQLDY
jgi:outer membrane protein OmpU